MLSEIRQRNTILYDLTCTWNVKTNKFIEKEIICMMNRGRVESERRGLGREGELDEGGQKAQTSSKIKKISTRNICTLLCGIFESC